MLSCGDGSLGVANHWRLAHVMRLIHSSVSSILHHGTLSEERMGRGASKGPFMLRSPSHLHDRFQSTNVPDKCRDEKACAGAVVSLSIVHLHHLGDALQARVIQSAADRVPQ